MASAVVRVKRRLEDEPLEALVLNCKKRKFNAENTEEQTSSEEIASTVLKFAGTIKEEDNVLSHLKKQQIGDLNELKDQFKKHRVNLGDKLRTEHQLKSKTNRYKIVNCFRSHSLEESESKENDSSLKSEITILDVLTDLNENDTNTKEEITEKSNEYVYDLYYTNSDDFGDAEIEDYVSIHPVLHDHNYCATYNNDLDSEAESEDSNAENFWTNDYPDEEDMQSITEDDMVDAMKKFEIGEDLLSSDDGEDGFVYSIDSEAVGFEEDIDESDVHRYGERYARFKAKNKNVVETSGLGHDLYYGDIDENEYYY